jgi:Mg2+-importing ATPase
MINLLPQITERLKENVVLSTLARIGEQKVHVVMKSLNTTQNGLDEEEIESRLKSYGPNVVAIEGADPWYIQLLRSLLNPFNLVLLALAVVSWITGDLNSVTIMLSMITISVSIRFYQEFRSNREAERLKAMVQNTALVQRIVNGKKKIVEIPMQELVPGDIVMISAGDMVPADIRLVSARDIFVSQAMLTGESVPVEKNDNICPAGNHAFDQINICFMGTSVVSGTAQAVVVATGKHTYLGSLTRAIVDTNVETTFEIGVGKISWLLIRFIFVMAPVVFFINGYTKGDWLEAMMFAISVAVGLTPEMLPMIVTANLAKGAFRMAKNKVIVKRLNAIHNFGAMDILCTDKTGTLTQDKVVLLNHLNLLGEEDYDVLKYGYLNSLHQTGFKNLLDVAVLEEAEKNSHDSDFFEQIADYTKVDELPFDFIRRRMSVIVEKSNKEHMLICKGAVEELISICKYAENDGKVLKLTHKLIKDIVQRAKLLNEDGFRVLIVAYRNLPIAQTAYDKEDEQELIIKGLLTFLDPPKESAVRALPTLIGHGVKTKVLTGDNAAVTRNICNQVGLPVEPMLLGKDIELLSDTELEAKVEEVVVFAKISPTQKSRIIRALKAKGHTVGFLGDGVNDAPALKEADVGISVDTAVDIAKEAADIILLEKNLMVLEEGIIEGRKTFINIIKYLKMALSSNFGNALSIVGSSIMLPFLPMLPIQLLIQNLLYDISQLAIPLDNVDKELIKKPKTWEAKELTRFMLFVGPISSIFDYITFAMLWFYFGASTIASESFFHTGWFIEGLVTQALIIHMIRTHKIPFIQDTASLPLILSSLLVIAIGIVLPYSIFAQYIGFVPLPASFLYLVGVIMVSYWLIISLLKKWYIRRFGNWM